MDEDLAALELLVRDAFIPPNTTVHCTDTSGIEKLIHAVTAYRDSVAEINEYTEVLKQIKDRKSVV